MNTTQAILAALLVAAVLPAMADPTLERGRYMTGDALGWRGPWGTTYPANLRLYMQGLGEDEWVTKAKALVTRPPMPWFALRDMSQDDLRAIYRYIRHLGPAGQPAPAYVPPGKAALTPVVQFPAEPK